MEIVPYRQSLSHSCLVACFLMMLQARYGIQFTERDEQRLALMGSRRIHPFYVAGIPVEIAREFKKDIVAYVDNKFFTQVLQQQSFDTSSHMRAEHKPITIELIQEELAKHPLICHVDTHGLGDYSHSSHFIVLERLAGKMVVIIDPWTGVKRKIAQRTLMGAIESLKSEVKMCPVLFTI